MGKFLARFKWYLLITILAVIFVIPIYATIITAFKTNQEIAMKGFMSLPAKLLWNNFINAWREMDVPTVYYNTTIITVCSILGSILVGSLTGYAFAFLKFRGSFPLFIIFVSGMFAPLQVALIPMFHLSSITGLYDTYFIQIFAHVSWTLPIATLILRNFFKTIPYELIEAARMDGLSHWKTYFRIILPIAQPAIGVLAIMEFTWIWNSFLWGLILSHLKAVPMMVIMVNILNAMYFIQWGLKAAGVIYGALPVLVVFLIFQRTFIKGLTMGAVK